MKRYLDEHLKQNGPHHHLVVRIQQILKARCSEVRNVKIKTNYPFIPKERENQNPTMNLQEK